MARVQVSDDVWAKFRTGLGVTPVNVALGELVEREVGRQHRRAASDVEGARLALEDARSVTQELETLTARLEGIVDGRPRSTPARPRQPPPGRAGEQASLADL